MGHADHLAAVALAWYAPITGRFLVEPPAAAHGVAIAWYAIASAALALTCTAMRDQWHRYTRNLHMPACWCQSGWRSGHFLSARGRASASG
jgi:hypothetical protein